MVQTPNGRASVFITRLHANWQLTIECHEIWTPQLIYELIEIPKVNKIILTPILFSHGPKPETRVAEEESILINFSVEKKKQKMIF